MKAPPSKKKLRVITIMFLVAGVFGIYIGLFVFPKPNFIPTALGIVNISLGIFLGFRIIKKDDKLEKRRK